MIIKENFNIIDSISSTIRNNIDPLRSQANWSRIFALIDRLQLLLVLNSNQTLACPNNKLNQEIPTNYAKYWLIITIAD